MNHKRINLQLFYIIRYIKRCCEGNNLLLRLICSNKWIPRHVYGVNRKCQKVSYELKRILTHIFNRIFTISLQVSFFFKHNGFHYGISKTWCHLPFRKNGLFGLIVQYYIYIIDILRWICPFDVHFQYLAMFISIGSCPSPMLVESKRRWSYRLLNIKQTTYLQQSSLSNYLSHNHEELVRCTFKCAIVTPITSFFIILQLGVQSNRGSTLQLFV